MPYYKQGNMFDHLSDYDYFFVTTNSYIKRDGSLVMGRGAALQLKEMFPKIPYIFGELVKQLCGHMGEYNLVYYYPSGLNVCIGAVQVKYHYLGTADLLLVQRSLEVLKDRALVWKTKKIALNYPGIGFGGLPFALVETIVDLLPDNIDVWRYK